MRRALISILLLACSLASFAQLSINFGSPGVSIGINLGSYPTLQRVPGYPVYYAPSLNQNYFFYDGLYWVYEEDNWYASSWYNGPWRMVDPIDVPLYVLRVPVRYYRHPPTYFRGWSANAAPRWGDHWGNSWQDRRRGWDQWNRKAVPAAAPLPTYQRQYTGSRYPQATQQAVIETRNYRYQPRDSVAQQHFQQQRTQAEAAQPQPSERQRPSRQPQQPRQQPVQPVPQEQAAQPARNPSSRPQPPEHAQPQPQQGKERQRPAAPQPAAEEQKGRGREQGKAPDRERDDNDNNKGRGRER